METHPSFDGATEWLNSEPLRLEDLSGHVVAVDFWTLTCINWLRTAPAIRAWSERYREDGLVVVGVHTPEFSFEHDVDRVREATAERGIDYPVAIDNDYAVWTSFGNNYWPALYSIDTDGAVRDQHPGEGRYWQPERLIQRLLGVDRDLVAVQGTGVEAPADWYHLRSSETYLGYARGGRLASPGGVVPDERHTYEAPRRLRGNQWALAGEWTVGPEHVALEQAGGTIACRFQARDVHLVLCPRSPDTIAFRVLLDGEPPGASHGVDIDEDGMGLLRAGRLYQLVRQDGEVGKRTIEITFLRSGAEAYAFTFG
jgi:thiol-disulfide isomerase/thioredoxin